MSVQQQSMCSIIHPRKLSSTCSEEYWQSETPRGNQAIEMGIKVLKRETKQHGIFICRLTRTGFCMLQTSRPTLRHAEPRQGRPLQAGAPPVHCLPGLPCACPASLQPRRKRQLDSALSMRVEKAAANESGSRSTSAAFVQQYR